LGQCEVTNRLREWGLGRYTWKNRSWIPVSTEFSRAGKATRNFAQSETVDLLIELVGWGRNKQWDSWHI
jgi:hypothetical protein